MGYYFLEENVISMTLLIGGSCYLDFAIIYIFAESVDIDISRDTIMSTIVMLCHLWYN